jgi:copper chaperone CopZ
MSRTAFLILVLISQAIHLNAQNSWEVQVGVDGLTCSACTRSVEMSLRRLDFVENVEMSLEETEGKITTKKDSPVDFRKLAKAITDAGFSVRFFKVQIPTQNLKVSEEGCFSIDNHYFQWVDYSVNQTKTTLQMIDKQFLPAKVYDRWKKKFKSDTCFKNIAVLHVTE